MTDTPLQDSGDRTEQYPGGATRDRAPGKGRYDLLSPFFMEAMAKHAEKGAVKYEARNYEQGMPITTSLDSAMRHLTQFAQGDDTEDHILAVAFNAMMIWHTRYMIERGRLPTDLATGYLPLHVVNPIVETVISGAELVLQSNCVYCGKGPQEGVRSLRFPDATWAHYPCLQGEDEKEFTS